MLLTAGSPPGGAVSWRHVPDRPHLSILIVTYDHGEEIDACLDAALEQGPDVELVVVDNASRDDTVQRVRGRDRVRLIEMGSNLGFAGAMNAAFAACHGERVVILNPDCVMEPGCAAALRAHLAARPDVGLAAALWAAE